MIGLVGLGYGLGRGQHTRKDPSAQCRQYHSDSTMIPFIGRFLHADVVVRHWNTVGNIVEKFPNGLCRKPNPFEIWSSFWAVATFNKLWCYA